MWMTEKKKKKERKHYINKSKEGRSRNWEYRQKEQGIFSAI